MNEHCALLYFVECGVHHLPSPRGEGFVNCDDVCRVCIHIKFGWFCGNMLTEKVVLVVSNLLILREITGVTAIIKRKKFSSTMNQFALPKLLNHTIFV